MIGNILIILKLMHEPLCPFYNKDIIKCEICMQLYVIEKALNRFKEEDRKLKV